MSAQRCAAVAELLDGIIQLSCGEIGKLQRRRTQRYEAIRVGLAPRRQPLIGRPDNLVREIAILYGIPPVAVDAQHLNVNSALIHFPYALVPHGSAAGVAREV